MNKGQSFFIALTMTLAGGIWLILHPVSLLVGGLTVVAVMALWWLPWGKLKAVRLVLSAVTAVLTLWSGLKLLEKTVCSMLPMWQIVLAVFLFILLICRCGKRAVLDIGVLLGGATAVILLYLVLRCIPLYHSATLYLSSDPTEWLGVLILLGAGLTAWQEQTDKTAVRWGGMVGCVLWFSMVLTACLSWSKESLSKLTLPLVTAWQRVDLFSVLSCPDVMAVALLSVCALIQWSAVLLSLFSLQKNKDRV